MKGRLHVPSIKKLRLQSGVNGEPLKGFKYAHPPLENVLRASNSALTSLSPPWPHPCFPFHLSPQPDLRCKLMSTVYTLIKKMPENFKPNPLSLEVKCLCYLALK